MKLSLLRHSILGAAAALALAAFVSGPATGQEGKNKGGFKAKAREPIKEEPTIWLSEGIPDLQGIWTNNWIVNMADARYAENTVEVPFTEWGKKLWEERTSTLQANDPNLQCKPSGLPRAAGTPYPLQIIQLPKEVVILYEGGLHTFRKIPVDGRAHNKDAWTWMGDSVGHYENGSLMIDVTGFNDEPSWLDSAGHPHSEQLHLMENYRRVNRDTIRYTVTIDDPKAYTRPWTTSYIYRMRPGTEIMEYWCTENERDARHMVGK